MRGGIHRELHFRADREGLVVLNGMLGVLLPLPYPEAAAALRTVRMLKTVAAQVPRLLVERVQPVEENVDALFLPPVRAHDRKPAACSRRARSSPKSSARRSPSARCVARQSALDFGGRIPQAFGRGCYGYRYDRATGRREVEPYQALIVRGIFERYAETRSFSAVCSELNAASVPAFAGGQWFPITVRRILTNECYTGRTVYRRTKRIAVRAPGARRRSRIVQQPEEEWIEIPDATPAIIEPALWARVQEILDDPARTARRPVAQRDYALRGRLKCTLCSSAMVGQTLRSKGKPYHYYRCRHVYARVSGRQCAGKYVPAGLLEAGVWSTICEVLTAPEIVVMERRRAAEAQVDRGAIQRLELEVAELRKRDERLVRMFSFEEADEATIRGELREVRQQRDTLVAELKSLKHVSIHPSQEIDGDALRDVCASVAQHLDTADEHRHAQVLEALQIAVSATRTEAIVEGVLPIEPPDFLIKSLGLSPLHEHGHHDMHVTLVADGAQHTGRRG